MNWRLNGWQRLWILAGTMYALVVVGFTWASFPTLDQIAVEQRYAPDPAKVVVIPYDKLDGFTIVQPAPPTSTGGMSLLGPVSSPEIGAKKTFPNGNVGEWDGTGWVMVSETDTSLEARVQALLRMRQREALGWTAVFWAVPMFSLYALGWSVGWVIRGFKQRKTG